MPADTRLFDIIDPRTESNALGGSVPLQNAQILACVPLSGEPLICNLQVGERTIVEARMGGKHIYEVRRVR